MKRNHQQVLSKRQIETLYVLAINGMKTVSGLSIDFEISQPTMNDTVKILKEKKLINIQKIVKGQRGKSRIFYELTNDGLLSLSKDKRIVLESFWKIAFHIYDKKSNNQITVSSQEFFSNYEREVLGYDLEYTPSHWSIVFEHFNVLYDYPIGDSEQMFILYLLGLNGPMTSDALLKRSRNQKTVIKYTKTRFDSTLLDKMVRDKLLMKNDGLQYRLSILGLILLMSYLDGKKSNILANDKHSEFTKEIRTIIKNANILPYVAESWNQLRFIIDELNVIQFFRFIAYSPVPLTDSIQLRGVKELLILGRIMGESYRKIVSREYRSGLKVLSKLEKDYPRGKPSEVYDRILFLAILDGFSVKEQEAFVKKLMGSNFSLDLTIEKSIANRVSFEFFTYFIDWLIRDKNTVDSEKQGDNWNTYIENRLEKWDRFQTDNESFRNWYKGWITEIRKFEERNVEIMKERDFLKIE